jgi:hypothetical protein
MENPRNKNENKGCWQRATIRAENKNKEVRNNII